MSSDAPHRLEIVLDRQIQMAELLSNLLAAEKEALLGKTPAEVVERATAKLTLLGQIEALERERIALWRPSVTPERQGIARRWQALMTLMSHCRRANEINGYIIHLRRSQVGELLSALRGGGPAIYGPQGRKFGRAPRALATA